MSSRSISSSNNVSDNCLDLDAGSQKLKNIPIFQRNRVASYRTHMWGISNELINIVYQIDLPGVQKENIEVLVNNGKLTINATRSIIYQPDPHKNFKLLTDDGIEKVSKEVGKFHVSIDLDHLINENKIFCRGLEDGVLTIVAPLGSYGESYNVQIN